MALRPYAAAKRTLWNALQDARRAGGSPVQGAPPVHDVRAEASINHESART